MLQFDEFKKKWSSQRCEEFVVFMWRIYEILEISYDGKKKSLITKDEAERSFIHSSSSNRANKKLDVWFEWEKKDWVTSLRLKRNSKE